MAKTQKRAERLNLPDKIKIGHLDYTVVYLPSLRAEAVSALGQCCNLTHEIRIRENQVQVDFACSVLHEIMHAIWWVWTIKDEDDEERTVNTLSNGLTAVWRDNPKLLKWFHETVG